MVLTIRFLNSFLLAHQQLKDILLKVGSIDLQRVLHFADPFLTMLRKISTYNFPQECSDGVVLEDEPVAIGSKVVIHDILKFFMVWIMFSLLIMRLQYMEIWTFGTFTHQIMRNLSTAYLSLTEKRFHLFKCQILAP